MERERERVWLCETWGEHSHVDLLKAENVSVNGSLQRGQTGPPSWVPPLLLFPASLSSLLPLPSSPLGGTSELMYFTRGLHLHGLGWMSRVPGGDE